MLPAKHRLTKDKEFNNIFKKGKSSYSTTLGIKVVKNNLDYSRFGILVGVKVSKKAIVRNRIKRLIREIIHARLKELKTGYDVVIIAQAQVVDQTKEEIKQGLVAQIKKLHLYK